MKKLSFYPDFDATKFKFKHYQKNFFYNYAIKGYGCSHKNLQKSYEKCCKSCKSGMTFVKISDPWMDEMMIFSSRFFSKIEYNTAVLA